MEPKYGIIGCGGISRFHFSGLEKLGAQIVHVADINEAAAKSYAQRFGAKCSTDYRRVIEDPDVTVVSVLTGAKSHYEICIAALKAGKDVICEKTMANNAEEAEEIVRTAQASGRLFFSAYMKRYFPAVQKAKELFPELGRIFSAQVRAYHPWGNIFESPYPEWVDQAIQLYGGAVIKMAGSHMIDMTQYFFGRPSSLYAHVDYIPETQTDRKVTSIWEYGSGMTVSFEALGHPLKKIGYERNSWDEKLEINGVNGRIELYFVLWDQPENNAVLLVHYDNERGTSTEYRFDAMNPFDEEMRYFHQCLINRERGHCTEVDGFNVDVIIETMVESSRTKASVAIDWKGL
ncbi:Gfo/Idh/MocA family protein [Paenibacillus mendelii]|uniref:Gfo/Idh/MocA family protein n=1 Tax=Paenibacillus mendelii TaxID=206163 RepID=A0ABV6J7V4_9BACL|nr:Gfo/Idh/MocA family oxidoreductase [Paenibacillus mendelii]MCQ6561013.1 Gfo/Idh/MocA family oxidoreductase [Paenibacillus mendelii]